MGNHGHVKQWLNQLEEKPLLRDAVIAGGWVVVGAVLLSLGITPLWDDVAVVTVASWAFTLTLIPMAAITLLRSRHPIIALGLGTIVLVIDVSLGASPGVVLLYLDVVYAAVKYGSSRALRFLFPFALIFFVIAVLGFFIRGALSSVYLELLLQLVVLVVISISWGWNVRSERQRTRDAMAVEHAEKQQVLQARIAHDLHDLVANHIAVAGLHIEAARLQLNSQSLDKLDDSLTRAKQGTDLGHGELRNLINVLTAVDDVTDAGEVAGATSFVELFDLLPADRRLVWKREEQERTWEYLSQLDITNSRVIVRVMRELITNAVVHGLDDVIAKTELSPHAMTWTLTNSRSAGESQYKGSGMGLSGARALINGVGGDLQVDHSPAVWTTTLQFPVAASEGDSHE